jgi:ceramide glucosyltransferase
VTALGIACLALAAIGCLYLLAAAWAVRATRRRGGDPRDGAGGRHAAAVPPSVTILKPLHGAEPGLFDTLATFCRQDYDGPFEIVLGLQDPADPALSVATSLRALFPDHAIRIVVDPRQHGRNRKVSNLINCAEGATGEIVVLADSDMRVGPDYLRRLVAALDRDGVGGATCLYHGVPAGTGWSRLAALGVDTHFLPGVVLGMALGLAKPCMGSTIAMRRETLERIGGFAAVQDALADDYEIGAAIRGLGLAVVVPPFTIGHVSAERSARDLVAQELRWLRTIRQIDPRGHAGSLVTHPLAFALLGAALAPGPVALLLLLTTIACRLALCLAVERAFGLRAHPYWLIPVRDGLSAGLFVASFFGRDVSWRGHRYEVARSGALLPKARPDPT